MDVTEAAVPEDVEISGAQLMTPKVCIFMFTLLQ